MASLARTGGPGASATPASAGRTARFGRPTAPPTPTAGTRCSWSRTGGGTRRPAPWCSLGGTASATPPPTPSSSPSSSRTRSGGCTKPSATPSSMTSAWSSPPAPCSSSTRWFTRSPPTPTPPRRRSASSPPCRITRRTNYRRRCSTAASTSGAVRRLSGPTRRATPPAASSSSSRRRTNNPDALLREPVLGGSAVISDHAYYWPHFTHIPAPADEDVMMFTMSKPSGHAGSRFGWALIRDENVAQRAYDYVQMSIMGASRDTQLRMLKIVKVMLANLHGEDDIFTFGHDVMRSRWRRLNAVVSRSRRISLQKIPSEYCTYFKRVREPSPAYAWVKCERRKTRTATRRCSRQRSSHAPASGAERAAGTQG